MAHVLVTGGVRSGKSRYAESLLSVEDPVSYLTPGYPADPATDAEWAARVAAHQLRRPASWRTVETIALADAVAAASGPVLIDCLGTWLTRLFDSWRAWESEEPEWSQRLALEASSLVNAIKEQRCDVVIVTNEVGWGVVSEYRSGRMFADNLGRINQQVAAACDQVVLMVAGRPLPL
ncbi:MAG TPA: bifunctional adenosylcobinamide kinase/adenosylcobinamide-phosphate guanylyltransferase [Propionicimonas sp.]|nr:bifunctional adenosylcobinamide kinase/adenosylcobinamide-phosphate guanylyltransferase [Propionicimonas sp.]